MFIISLIVFALLGSSADSPTSIYADWGKDTFDVYETTEVKITDSPSNADITSLEPSSNDIAELNYTNGKAVISFKEPGEEAQAKAEEEARIKAEQEAQAKAEEEARIKAEQEASVWLSATGSKYHSIPDCGNMNPDTARQVSLSEAQSMGYEPCKNCH